MSDFFLISTNLILAAVFGAIVGLERDIHHKPAGLRTHILVSVGAALFTIISIQFSNMYGGVTDPSRVAAQIVTGIGFIGAGAVIKSGFNIHGITTAATLWICAAIGMAVGLGSYFEAAFATFLALFALIVLNHVEMWYLKPLYKRIHIVIPLNEKIANEIYAILDTYADIQRCNFSKDYQKKLITFDFILRITARGGKKESKSPAIVEEIEKKVRGIRELSCEWA